MIQAIEVQESQEHILFSLMQKYLYEMTAWYPNTMDADGNYPYPYLPCYFVEKDRQAFFFYDGSELIGFALVNTHSFTGEAVDSCIAEFTIFPAYRRRGKAMEAIEALMAVRKGTWQLKYSTENFSGAVFWQKVKAKYHGREQVLEGNEIAITLG